MNGLMCEPKNLIKSRKNAPYSHDPLFTSITCLVSACCFQTSGSNLAGAPSTSQTTLFDRNIDHLKPSYIQDETETLLIPLHRASRDKWEGEKHYFLL